MATITITISDTNLNAQKEKFLRLYPIPLDPETHEPLHTAKVWFGLVIKKQIIKMFMRGGQLLAKDAAIFDISIIDVA